MVNGFVYAYRGKSDYPILYFYPGYTDNMDKVYADIDLSGVMQEYTWKRNLDGSIKCVFQSKNIKTITCQLYNNITKETQELEFDI